MSPNPYQPPTADVGDAAQISDPRPSTVRLACQLVLAALALGLVTLLPGVDIPRPDAPDVHWLVTVALVAVFCAITIWLTQATYNQRNWARWALLAYLLLGWILAIGELGADFQYSLLTGILNVACLAMELFAMWLLFTGSAARWFSGSVQVPSGGH